MKPSDEDIKTFAGNGPQTLLTPEALANELRRSRVQIADLEREVEAMRKKKEDAARAQAAIDQHFEQSRKQYREEAERLKDQRDAEVARANDERDRAIKKMQENG